MTTISAKELRDQLDAIVRRVRAGEQIRVTYRSKPAFTIIPDPTGEPAIAPGSNAAVGRFLQRVNSRKRAVGTPVFDPNKPVKQLYHEMLDNDPKYKPPYHG